MLSLVGSARAELNLDFILINKTGYPIKELYICPTTSDDWGENLFTKSLKDGESFDLKFSPKETSKKWDIKVVYEDGDKAQWIGLKLEEISKVSFFWDNDKQKSTAKTE